MIIMITLVPWQSGKSLCWNVTVTCPLAESYVARAASEAGAAAEMAATRKEEKYVDLSARYLFEPIAVETLGPRPTFCTTVCRPLTAQIDDHTPICISIFLIFYLPRDHMYRGFKKNNNNNVVDLKYVW